MIEPESDREADFAGLRDVTIPARGSATSDPIEFPVQALARLSISLYFKAPPTSQTGHRRSVSTSWVAQGDQLGAAGLSKATAVEHWYQLAAVQVEAPDAHVIVTLGDSITDGSLSTPDANARWPDVLAERLQATPATRNWAVANQGIAGNQLLADDFGASALARFDHDVLSQPHARTVVLLEGVNDLGQLALTTQAPAVHRALVARIIEAYGQLISLAHDRGLRIVGSTLMPDGGSDYHPTSLDDQDRHQVNAWIRMPGHFDAVIDWDAVMRDPDSPTRLRPQFDSGDHIHPSSAGYRAMADAIQLDLLVK